MEDKVQGNIFKILQQELFLNLDLKNNNHTGKFKKMDYIINNNFSLPKAFYKSKYIGQSMNKFI